MEKRRRNRSLGVVAVGLTGDATMNKPPHQSDRIRIARVSLPSSIASPSGQLSPKGSGGHGSANASYPFACVAEDLANRVNRPIT